VGGGERWAMVVILFVSWLDFLLNPIPGLRHVQARLRWNVALIQLYWLSLPFVFFLLRLCVVCI
jgi:hypothetical protein